LFSLVSWLLIFGTTANNVFNNSLFDVIKPQSLLTWQRVLAAMALATNGEEWCSNFAKYNSGTCNDSSIVVDFMFSS